MNKPAEGRAPFGLSDLQRWSLSARRWMARALAMTEDGPPAGTRSFVVRRALGFGVAVGLMLTVTWAILGAHYFWPGWFWFALALPIALHRSVRRALETSLRRSVAVHAAIAVVISCALVVIWLLSNHRVFWPVWPILGLCLLLAGHAAVMPTRSSNREKALEERVEVLTRRRKDALDVQEAEMRRVERDLHDGAQARLVSLGMSLGLADELLDKDLDEARRLLSEARTAAGDALGDLRALVRGILPPILADRGLAGAVDALVLASPIPARLSVALPNERLPAPVESAAYFAIAEALANVVKHSGARAVSVRVCHAEGVLSIVVEDDGQGGADPGRGSGLRGIRRRIEAFDGSLGIASPAGGPTVVSMEVPCELSSPKTSPS